MIVQWTDRDQTRARVDDREVTYSIQGGIGAATGDVLLALALLPAMRLGAPLDIGSPVSGRLLGAVPRIQSIYRTWWPEYAEIPVAAEVRHREQPASGVGCFFSGGLDSWYSVLQHRDAITHLIFVVGFDIALTNLPLLDQVLPRLHAATDALGLPLVVVTTNGLREFSDRLAGWPHYHGGALASVAHLLAPQVGKVIIPASHILTDTIPWGSHPDLDPCWSSDAVELVHDGAEATRVQKAALVATSDLALRTLRVCWENPGGAYNCGQCEKCLRTMVNLRIVGALDRCTTFDHPLDLQRLAETSARNASTRAFIIENLQAVRERGTDRPLEAALLAMLERSDQREPEGVAPIVVPWYQEHVQRLRRAFWR